MKFLSNPVIRIRIAVLAVVLATGVSSCGGDEPEGQSREEIEAMMAARKAKFGSKKKAVIPDSQMVSLKIGKPGWKLLAAPFKKFLEEGYTSNIFQARTNEMIPRPRLVYPADGFGTNPVEEINAKKAKKESVHPLEAYTVGEYTLVLTMLGTSQPKAVVVDPKGVDHTVTVNPPTWLGKKRYLVKRITKYNVELESQGEKKTLGSIRPPYIGEKQPEALKRPTASSDITEGVESPAPAARQ